MKKNLFIAALVLFSLKGFSQTTWAADKAHSKITFTVVHLLVTDVDGTFKNFDVKVVTDKPDFNGASISFTADVNSVNTDNDYRDNDLKSPKFFDAAKFGTITFQSTSFTKLDTKNYKLAGNLTMHGVTKAVVLNVVLNGVGVNPMSKKDIAGFKLSGTINRSDFGVGSGMPTSIVSDEVTLGANIELDKQ